ncbi:MAG: sugar ABC transporter permease [Oscillospiraceae bacterium]|nr:sugar ABC transporter permease [Oscillospiraceae bacterium]
MKKREHITRQRRLEALTGYAFVTPQLIGFILLVLIPLINVFIYSFHNKNMLYGTNLYVGLSNYEKLFTGDKLFWKTLGNTFRFSILLVPLNLVLSFLLALYLGERLFGSRYIRTVIFLPVVTSGVAWAIVWKYLLQSGTAGPINYFLSKVGITGPNWLTDKNWAMISVVINRVLKNLGTNVLIFLGAVMNMPQDVIEAARLDGANEWAVIRRIKLPLLMPTVLMVTIVTMIGSMRVFDTIRLMTDGGPEGSTMVLVYYIYHQAFKMFNTGYASAIAVILFIIVLLLTILQWTLRKKVSHYEDA